MVQIIHEQRTDVHFVARGTNQFEMIVGCLRPEFGTQFIGQRPQRGIGQDNSQRSH